LLPTVHAAAHDLWQRLRDAGSHLTAYEVERALIDAHGVAERRFELVAGPAFTDELADLRSVLSTGSSLAAMEAKCRYDLINAWVNRVERRVTTTTSLADRLDQFASHPLLGSMLFILVMGTVFQAVFSWATPMMDLIDAATTWLSSILPFIIVLEDSGYMPRAAFMMGRLMRSVGLSGQSFIPMLSSFACAVPGIMATRVIPERRDRLATMLAAPFMTCSARLPIYALLIAAFVPQQYLLGDLVNLQGLVLFGLYMLGIAGGVMTALLMKRTLLRGPTPTFLIELPPYRLPNLRSVLIKLMSRARIFLTRAGTVIFTVAVVIWALAYFPRPTGIAEDFQSERGTATAQLDGDARDARLAQLEQQEAATYLEQSMLGRMGKLVTPVFEPLGWDWKVSAAVIAGFPAREVVIAVLGTIYAVGDAEANENALVSRLRNAQHDDGTLVFTVPMVLGLLVFYAFCLQCAATIAVIGRETGTWRWPLFAWIYMTGLGYLAALLIYRGLG
jgi:ferrous iron transport protein B